MDSSSDIKKMSRRKGIRDKFTVDRGFYRTMLGMLIGVSLQNIVAYSVNMVDNLMLGSYSQDVLSGAATVNQIFYMVQAVAGGISSGLSVLTSQYWGAKKTDAIRILTATGLRIAIILGSLAILMCIAFPEKMLLFFTSDPAIIDPGMQYLGIIRWTFLLFLITNILMAVLRSVEVVRISFYTSLISLILNVVLNYCLIFGNLGFRELGIRGAAIGTLIGRIVELGIVFQLP